MESGILDLLVRWEEERKQGRTLTPEELCRGCPELLESVRRHLEGLRSIDRRLGETSPSATAGTVGRDVEVARPGFESLRPGLEPMKGYRLLKRLGRGGFGEVWKAQGPGGFRVALKFVPLAGKLGETEVRALKIMAKLRHPNVVAVSGAWKYQGLLVVAMDLADGTLWDRLQETRRSGQAGIPRDELLGYMEDAAKGLAYLNEPEHSLGGKDRVGVQHRDVKPQNLLLVGNGVKVGDFGLARLLEHSVTSHTGSLTVAYAAPEFFRGETSRASDQYSLAVTYCLFRGGRLPFQGSAAQQMAGHLTQVPDVSLLPESERAAVLRALSKDPQARWPDCRSFVAALRGNEDTAAQDGGGSGLPLDKLRMGSHDVDRTRLPGWLGDIAPLVQSDTAAPGSAPHYPQAIPLEGPRQPARVRCEARAVKTVVVGLQVNEPGPTAGRGRAVIWISCLGILLAVVLVSFALSGGVSGPDRTLTAGDPASTRRAVAGSSTPPSSRGTRAEPAAVRPNPPAEERVVLRGHRDAVLCLATSPDGRVAVTGGGKSRKDDAGSSGDTSVRVWDLVARKEVGAFRGHKATVRSVAITGNGSRVISGDAEGVLSLWDIASFRELRRHEMNSPVESLTTLPGSDTAIVANGSTVAHAWTPKIEHTTIPYLDFKIPVWQVVILGDQSNGPVIASSGNGDLLLRRSTESTLKIYGHGRPPVFATTPDRTRIISGAGGKWADKLAGVGAGTSDNSVRVWDVATRDRLRTFDGHTQLVVAVASSPDGRCALSGSLDGTMMLWSIPGAHTRADVTIPIGERRCFRGHDGPVYGVAFLPDGDKAISCGQDGTVRLWPLPR